VLLYLNENKLDLINFFSFLLQIVDASRAGEGNLEISVNYSGRNIPNQVTPIANSRFEVQFTPQEATMHYCNILFNGEPVPGKQRYIYKYPNKRKTTSLFDSG
jgi:hypothetical protein